MFFVLFKPDGGLEQMRERNKSRRRIQKSNEGQDHVRPCRSKKRALAFTQMNLKEAEDFEQRRNSVNLIV